VTGVPTAPRAVDVDHLSEALRHRIRGLVEAAGFFSLPASLRQASPRSWDFQYRLTVEDGGRSHTVVAHSSAHPGLQRLVDALEELPD
jgi:hypothetical protein